MTKENSDHPVPAPRELSQQELDWRHLERQAVTVSRSQSSIPAQYRDKPGDIIAAWMMAKELGLSQMQALRSIYVVNGKPQLSGDVMMALALGNNVKVVESMHVEAPEGGKDADPTKTYAKCIATTKEGNVTERTFSVRDAMTAGLWNANDVWRKYGARMLQMRARGFCLRDAIPHILMGCYIEGELTDPVMKDVTPDRSTDERQFNDHKHEPHMPDGYDQGRAGPRSYDPDLPDGC